MGAELMVAYRDVAFAARDSGLRGETLRQAIQEYAKAAAAYQQTVHEHATQGKVSVAEVAAADATMAEASYWLEEAQAPPP